MVVFTAAHKERDPANVKPDPSCPTNGQNGATSSFTIQEHPIENFRPVKVIIIGAGFSGIYCGVRFPQRLKNVQLTIYEKNQGVGGTWFENRYPGCACDVPAHSYQYSFDPNPNWSSFYAPSDEIQAYLQKVAEKYSVTRFVKLSHKVTSCHWNQDLGKWKVSVKNLESGDTLDDEADIVISARGTLNEKAWPEIDGFSDMKIPTMHSAAWNESYDLQNKRIGVIGGGSSSIQIIPHLQKTPGTHLTCFVRSRTWISRPFGDSAVGKLGLDSIEFSEAQKNKFRANPDEFLIFRSLVERESNSVHALTLKDSPMQKFVRDDFTAFMKKRLEKKPELFGSLLPGFGVGCRRLTPGPGYLEALVEDNVDFVSTPIRKCLPSGVELADGKKIELDVLVCATGFHTSAPPPFPVVGKDGRTLFQRFDPYPETYLSMATDGFPNYFMMLGPNAAIGSGSLTMMIEMEGDYIIKCVRKIQKENIKSIEVKEARVKDFSAYIDAYFKRTVYSEECNSWYRSKGGRGSRVTGLWPGSTLHAIETFRSPRWKDFEYVYEGEEDGAEGNRLSWLGNGWSSAQIDDDDGDLAFYLQPEFVDVPVAPLPETTRIYRMRPFSY